LAVIGPAVWIDPWPNWRYIFRLAALGRSAAWWRWGESHPRPDESLEILIHRLGPLKLRAAEG